MQVSQPARSLFDIGFEVINGVVKFSVPLMRKFAQLARNGGALRLEKFGQPAGQRLKQNRVAGHKVPVHQADRQFDIAFVDFAALAHVVHRMA